MEVTGAAEGSLFQLVVNGAKQQEPEPALRQKIVLPPGRHSILVEVTGADGSIENSNPVEVYVLGDAPTEGFRANLSSVNIETEGWEEAIRQYDGYVADGHDLVQLAPSDPYPSLVPGFWNIFVEGFGDGRDEAQFYCEQFELAIPDQCFPTNFDPDAPAGEEPAESPTTTVADDGASATDATVEENP